MALETTFVPLTVEELPALAAAKKDGGWRFVQLLAVNTEDGIDLVYSLMKDNLLENHEIKGVQKGTTVPSITDRFLEAFVFENETHDLFGVDVQGIAIDFGGNFYALAQKEPMTIISPEQKAAREGQEGGRRQGCEGEGRQGGRGERRLRGDAPRRRPRPRRARLHRAARGRRSGDEAGRHGPREGRPRARGHRREGQEGGRRGREGR